MPFFGWNTTYRVCYEWLISIIKEIIGLKEIRVAIKTTGLPFWIYEQKIKYQRLENENERLKTRNEKVKNINERLNTRN